ncbi:hypothetical protein M758_12G100800 [Ceratodon purpureus]|nr:hypothetical protein M758_12G100800 [Ceratodon purpureus]
MSTSLPSMADGTSRLVNSGTQTRILDGWKIVKNVQTRVRVLRRFGAKCRIETTWVELQCSACLSDQVVSTQLEKSSPESAVTKIQIGRRETKKARDVCREFALDPAVFCPMLLTLIVIQGALKDPPGESIITNSLVVVTVTVWLFTRIPAKKQVIILCIIGSLMKGAQASDLDEDRKEDSTDWEAQNYAKIAITLVAVLIGGAGVARFMCNRWRPLQVNALAGAGALILDDIDAALVNSEWRADNEDFTLWPEI